MVRVDEVGKLTNSVVYCGKNSLEYLSDHEQIAHWRQVRPHGYQYLSQIHYSPIGLETCEIRNRFLSLSHIFDQY